MSTVCELLGAPDRVGGAAGAARVGPAPAASSTTALPQGAVPPRPVDLTRQNSMDRLGDDQRELKQEAAALVPHLFRIGLFSMPGEEYAPGGGAYGSSRSMGGDSKALAVDGQAPAAPPLAKHPATRDLACALLTALARGSASACARLMQLCATLHSTSELGADIGADRRFDVKPEDGESKSDTGFCGIRNLGCICYMNSTLQQLYNIVPFRQALLDLRPEDVSDSQGIVVQLQRMYSFLKVRWVWCVRA